MRGRAPRVVRPGPSAAKGPARDLRCLPYGLVRLGAFVLCVGLALSGCGTVRTVEVRLADEAAVEHNAAAAEITLPTSRCGDLFIVAVTFDGTGPRELLLDTGFPRTQLAPALARELGARRSVQRMSVGGLQASGRIPVDVSDMDAVGLALGRPIDGILGYDLFADLLLTLDFPGGIVRVARGALAADSAGVVPMRGSARPTVRAEAAGRRFDLVIDSGFSGSVALAEVAGLPLVDSLRLVGARVRVDGVSARRAARLDGSLSFGAFVLHRPIVDEAVGRNLLGISTMRHFVVTLDARGGRARFTPVRESGREVLAPPRIGSGMVLRPHAAYLEVVDVIAGSAAADAGVRPGDRVLTVDGMPAATRGCPDPDPEAATRPQVLGIERDGERLEATVEPGVLVP